MEPPLEEALAEVKQITTRLALGLIRQDEAIRKGIASPATHLDEQLQGGWDDLTQFCLQHALAPPRHLPDLVTWLHQPLESWEGLGNLIALADLSGTLLAYGIPTEYCYELSREMHLVADPERELQDVPFKEILSYCKHYHLVEQYREARLFLIKNPYLPYGGITISSNPDWDSEIRKWLRQCYEPVPLTCYRYEGHCSVIACCPRCGWPLEWRSQKHRLARCYSDLCSRLAKNFHDPGHWFEVSEEAMRTTRGIQISVVAPEVPLLRLVERIERELGLVCPLWPEVDNFDALVPTSHGENWALDMKDHVSPKHLATQATPFEPLPEWHQAFYVFPEHRRTPGYLRAFYSVWKQPARTQAFFVNEFFEYLQEYEQTGVHPHA